LKRCKSWWNRKEHAKRYPRQTASHKRAAAKGRDFDELIDEDRDDDLDCNYQ
jgi:hypothetical protein